MSGPPTILRAPTAERQRRPSITLSSSESALHRPKFTLDVVDLTLDDSADEGSSTRKAEQDHTYQPDIPITSVDDPSKTLDDGLFPTDIPSPVQYQSPQRRMGRASSTSKPENKNNTPWHNDKRLHRYLKQPGGTPSRRRSAGGKDDKAGYVYVLKREPDAKSVESGDFSIVKVGRSKDPIGRRRNIEGSCRMRLEEVVNREQDFMLQADVAENLAKHELAPWRHTFDCECGTKHGEYFHVKEREALEVVQRWVRFCQRNPWDRNGNLRTFWFMRLEAFARIWQNEEHDLDDKRWEDYTQPWLWEEPWFNFCAFLMHLIGLTRWFLDFVFENRWPLSCFAQGVCTMLLYGEVNTASMFWTTVGAIMVMVDNAQGYGGEGVPFVS